MKRLEGFECPMCEHAIVVETSPLERNDRGPYGSEWVVGSTMSISHPLGGAACRSTLLELRAALIERERIAVQAVLASLHEWMESTNA